MEICELKSRFDEVDVELCEVDAELYQADSLT
jgi:hypothetical protein